MAQTHVLHVLLNWASRVEQGYIFTRAAGLWFTRGVGKVFTPGAKLAFTPVIGKPT